MKRKAYKLLILIIVAALLLVLCGCAEPVISPSGTTVVLPSPTPTPTPTVIRNGNTVCNTRADSRAYRRDKTRCGGYNQEGVCKC